MIKTSTEKLVERIFYHRKPFPKVSDPLKFWDLVGNLLSRRNPHGNLKNNLEFIVRSRFQRNMSFSQMAPLLGVAASTVRDREAKAIEILRHWRFRKQLFPHFDFNDD